MVALLVLSTLAAQAKKQPPPPPPPEGWHAEPGWKGACWYPPSIAGLATGPMKEVRQKTLEAIVSQWRGDREDGVAFPTVVYENVETVILSKMDRLEGVAAENLEMCKAAMVSGDTVAWKKWAEGVPGKLTVGECNTPPLDYTMYDYLSVNTDWQITGHVCKGDRVRIKGSEMDEFRLEKNGAWVKLDGDRSKPTSGNYPCNIEGCFAGMLIMKYTPENGNPQVIPIGLEAEFLVPEHGRIQVMINDIELTDNAYKVENRLEHHASIEYSGVGK